jgi:D-glycero-alpha-D-manno-heptose-7-phosphate kinase
MIITRSPLRISLGGGGTDLPSYYKEHTGFIVAAAIDKYVYITLHRTFVDELIVKYSKMERVRTVDEVQHPIIREAMKFTEVLAPYLEIASMADIPAGTGLGSSGSFTTALLKALYSFERRLLLPGDLARLACELEIERLGRPVGKQDQYIAAYGGITCFDFDRDGSVRAEPLQLAQSTLHELEDHLLMFFTGFSRSASDILKDQDDKTKQADAAMVANLDYVKELGHRIRTALERGKPEDFGALMHEHWDRKRKRSSGMSNANIDEWYEIGRKAGAIGGKLVGAGGGGFLMFYAPEPQRVRAAMAEAKLAEVRFRFDFDGTRVLYS